MLLLDDLPVAYPLPLILHAPRGEETVVMEGPKIPTVDQYHELGVSQGSCTVSLDHLKDQNVPNQEKLAVCRKEGGNSLEELTDWGSLEPNPPSEST